VISNVLLLEDGGDADAVQDMEVSIEEDEGDDNTLFIRHIINKFEDRLEVKARAGEILSIEKHLFTPRELYEKLLPFDLVKIQYLFIEGTSSKRVVQCSIA